MEKAGRPLRGLWRPLEAKGREVRVGSGVMESIPKLISLITISRFSLLASRFSLFASAFGSAVVVNEALGRDAC